MIKLPSELAINKVEELYQQFVHELETGQPICIDIHDVIKVDTASIQMLCALQKRLMNSDQQITWHGESRVLFESVEQLGLTDILSFSSKI
ncbi:STAS domain-containing protein [Pseudoalteromonas luteoviolacea]|uniref:STAS domain-containing protein n=1 Tax=Pseudoalteromonas luteoviolacea DSM 6061 TaxID=1365250 RepID=A0A166UEU6_9GAMM|nr:STAS domain-containing protein [Pseudoalteromonas luteoviolacea]KZN29946.1 hypothetical protein N475_24780 [Pseudoalteromonas luteoviolacea DSM 6061]KZN51818.1 hypothetical protein N474_03400 [Pseudoalteromonas luteoviolacea CPMOR-2]MBE0388287.1 hypothetical protein [Pseudoalteromonas luteoviolacea DSM 6061]TQF72960.1 STAS domain-containing protein [Pseudoalteromonas luteoviolacea]